MSARDDGVTSVRVRGRDRVVTLALAPVVGIVLAVALPPTAAWARDRTDATAHSFFEAIARADACWLRVAVLVVAALAGATVGAYLLRRTLVVDVEDDRVRLRRGGTSTTFAGEDIEAAFLDQERLVLLDALTRELVREPFEADRDELADAFRSHHYPWNDTDPYHGEYRRWVHDSAELDAAAHAVFRTRARAVESDARDEADSLRRRLADLGYVVRDEGNRQYWRRTL